jgi:hypothetical protein
MKLDWIESHRGYGPGGYPLADITHITGPDGSDHGWAVWLIERRLQLTPRYPDAEAARLAAATALDPQLPGLGH